MDSRRRSRLGSGTALVAVALLGGSEVLRSHSPAQLVFDSRPRVAALECPATDGAAARPPVAPADRIPDSEELEAEAIDSGRMLPPSPAPKLPEDVVRRFALPRAGGEALRIGVWGDSHVAAGFVTDELAKHAEARGLAVQTRIIPASAGRPGIRLPLRKVCKSPGWQFSAAYNAPAPVRVGPALASLRSTKTGDYVWLDLRQRPDRLVRAVLISYLPARAPTAIGIRVDDGAEARVELLQPSEAGAAPGVLAVRASSTISTLRIRVIHGEAIVQGLALDYATTADVTIDVFGLPSATVTGWLNADAAYLRKSIDPAGYDAVVLEYGTNEGAVGRFEAPRYAANLAAALRNMRVVFPDAACLLIGPTDRGVRVPERRGSRVDFLQYSRVHQQIARLQVDVGARFGCAVWDWQRYMGGAGSIYAWARATPPLAAADLIHLTLPGYRRSAAALAQSIGWSSPSPRFD